MRGSTVSTQQKSVKVTTVTS